jgi:putative transposase
MDREPPKPPENPENCVGIDVGILTYAHDTDGTAVGSLDLSDERERLKREQRKLPRKQHGSANYEKQRRRVAECHADHRRKRRDFLHKLLAYSAREYVIKSGLCPLSTAFLKFGRCDGRHRGPWTPRP